MGNSISANFADIETGKREVIKKIKNVYTVEIIVLSFITIIIVMSLYVLGSRSRDIDLLVGKIDQNIRIMNNLSIQVKISTNHTQELRDEITRLKTTIAKKAN